MSADLPGRLIVPGVADTAQLPPEPAAAARFARAAERRAAMAWARLRGRIALLGHGLMLGPRLDVLGAPIVERCHGSRIEIDERVVLCSVSRWTALGVAHPVVLRTLHAGALLRIGADTGISGGSFCAAERVEIGRRCLFGADVVVTDTDFHARAPEGRRHQAARDAIATAPVRIGDDVFVGTGAVILKGVEIGNGAVVGARAVVTRPVPARAVVAGNPARVVGQV